MPLALLQAQFCFVPDRHPEVLGPATNNLKGLVNQGLVAFTGDGKSSKLS